jgi:hypothetical protein
MPLGRRLQCGQLEEEEVPQEAQEAANDGKINSKLGSKEDGIGGCKDKRGCQLGIS